MRVSDILSKKRLSTDFQIWRLVQLGWTQNEVGEAFGLKQHSISEIIGKFSNEINDIQKTACLKWQLTTTATRTLEAPVSVVYRRYLII